MLPSLRFRLFILALLPLVPALGLVIYQDLRARDATAAEVKRQALRLVQADASAGFASLRHIVQLDPEIIKLDITLTRGISSNPTYRAMGRAPISFARDTGKEVVAEGIETREELASLRALGVALGQGYLLARPDPSERLRALCPVLDEVS